jgi:TolB-like protein/Flp pilus assembly protein TadD
MTSFFDELKRRKVYRVAVAYGVAAAGVIQLASAVFPAWELPNWTLRLTVVVLLIGFPVALVLAWAFDVTPQGIQSTPPLPQTQTAGAVGHNRRRNIFLLIGSGVAISAVAGFFLLPRAGASKMDKSIAVLPFENFSATPENAYFADGIQDDILTNLSKIGDLKVISRTSVMAYRGKPKSVKQIGKELGVGAILEGSVRRESDRVRVNVQLINAATDQHIWAEDYDRELTDVFAIQTDLAQKIAHELQAQLSPSEKAELTQKPTANNDAYLVFLDARRLQHAVDDSEKLKGAIELYERAIQLDPNYVQAIANLSITHSWLYHTSDPSEARRELARKYADQALAVAPNSPEAHLARGFCLYYGDRDFNAALHEFGLAKAGLPNDDEAYLVIGAIQRRQDKWVESTANLEKAVALNPKSTWPLQNLFFNYQMQRQFDAASKTVDRALALDSRSASLWGLKVKLAIASRGDFSVAEKAFAKFNETATQPDHDWIKDLPTEVLSEIVLGEASVRMLQRRYADALQVVRRLPEQTKWAKPHVVITARLIEGCAHQQLGEVEAAHAAFLKAKELAEAAVREEPKEESRHALLARVLARLGQKDAAIAEAQKAVELLPISVDAFEGPQIKEALAEVYAVTGENAKAVAVLEELLARPSDITIAGLKLDPTFDGLRSDPAFQNLLKNYSDHA